MSAAASVHHELEERRCSRLPAASPAPKDSAPVSPTDERRLSATTEASTGSGTPCAAAALGDGGSSRSSTYRKPWYVKDGSYTSLVPAVAPRAM